MPKNSYRTAVRPWLNAAIANFIDKRLAQHGSVNRKDIMDEFGVSIVTASRYLNSYREMKPDAMMYDPSAKTYRAFRWSAAVPALRVSDVADEVKLVLEWLAQEHERYMTSLGRNPAEYTSNYSLTADALRSRFKRAQDGNS